MRGTGTNKHSERVTFTLPARPKRTPFNHYRGKASTTPALDPYRFTHQKLGLTATEFETAITDDIDALLQEIETTRRQELLDTLPFEKPIPKEECLGWFRTTGPPTTGSLLGIYRRASSSNSDVADEDHSTLNAQD